MEIFDVIVLGGGPAGYLAAERAAEGGLKTLVFEKRSLGGVCLNEGCIPSKTLLNSAKIYDYAKHDGEKYGVTTTGAAIDHKKVIARKDKVVRTLVSGVEASLAKLKVSVIKQNAVIEGKTENGFCVSSQGEKYYCKNLLIATGSEALVPPIPGVKEGLESGFVVTNREVFQLTELPKELVVIGGGVIGIEMASYFCSADCSVTVIEMLDNIGGGIDADTAKILLDSYKKKGINFKLGCKVTAVKDGAVEYICEGKTEGVKADKVLMSIGRRPNIQHIGLESLGVHTERGAIVTDDYMKTNIPGVYAAGDVNGKSMLAHTAYREAEVAINNIFGKKDIMSYNAIPAVIYTNPEIACAGETEESAKAKGYDVKTVNLIMQYSGRYVAENEGGNGICKVVYDKKNDRVLGIQMVGGACSEMIYGAVIMIENQMKLDNIKKIVFPHPTVSEIIREAIFKI